MQTSLSCTDFPHQRVSQSQRRPLTATPMVINIMFREATLTLLRPSQVRHHLQNEFRQPYTCVVTVNQFGPGIAASLSQSRVAGTRQLT